MANNTIKGLTVEIGGDTTKLGKALEDVNKKSRSLSSELGEINKLLKLDPGNADLLAQKQKVLADAVGNTKEKLETLKAAEKQVQEQFERGEVSEEQVRALQREIVETTQKLEAYERAVKETADALDNLGDESEDAGDNLDDASKGSKKAGKNVEDLGDEADDASKDVDDLADSAKDAERGTEGLGKAAVAAGTFIGNLASQALSKLTEMLGAAIETSREYNREMGKLQTAFETGGHSAETATKTYKALQGVLGETDQAVEAANHLAKLTDNEQDLEKWTDICTGVYATFGASIPIEGLTEAANETAKTGALTGSLADALNWAGVSEDDFQLSLEACTTEQERQALITETLSGLYGEAADKYREVNAEVIRANQANDEWAASLAEVGGAIEPLLTDVKLLGASLLSEFVPGVKEAAGAFRVLLNGDDGAAADLGEAVSGIFSQLLNKITEMLPAAAEMAVSLITTLASSIGMALPGLLETGVEVVLALSNGIISAIPSLLATVTTVIPHLVQAIVTGIPQIIQAGVDLLLALAQAIPQILPQLALASSPICSAIIEGLLMAVPQLIEGALQFLMAIVQAIPMLIAELAPQMLPIVTTIVDELLANIPLLISAALELLDAIIQAIPLLLPPLIEALPQIINTIVNGLVKAVPQIVQGAIQLLNGIIKAIPIIIQALIPQLPKIVTTIVNELVRMSPVLVDGAFQLFLAIVKAIPQVVGELIKALPQILQTIVSVLGGGVKLVFNIGKDLVRGLWNGIKDMTSWVIGKIQGFGESILGGIKSFFGIKSPSRVFRDQVGKMLTEGMADGIEANADAPLNAMTNLSNDLLNEAEGLNGLALERSINHTFGAPDTVTAAETGMLGKLDKILAAIERGQVLLLDGKALVGATADMTDNALGRRRALVARGAV